MEKRRKHLNDLFRYALILLGILSAAELSYFLRIGNRAEFPYIFFVFTAPYVLIVGTWMAKELGREWIKLDMRLLLTEFCWSLWIATLIYYLLFFWLIRAGGFVEIAIVLCWGLTFALVFLIGHAYKRAYRSVVYYFKSPKWILIRFTFFMIAYSLVTFVILTSRPSS